MKRMTTIFYKPFLEKYLSKVRRFNYENIQLIIPPEVFHPGFFFSTKIFIKYIKKLDIANKKFLELGAGSGLISMIAAKRNAIVTATDINPVAIEYLKTNSVSNNVVLNIIESDLFSKIPRQIFEVIVINPPYFKQDPVSYKDFAWYCGQNGEYFQNLFRSLENYINIDSDIFMMLSEDCDIEMIGNFASENNFKMNCVYRHKNFMEKNFIYKIENNMN